MTDSLNRHEQLLVQLLQPKQKAHYDSVCVGLESGDWLKIIKQARRHQLSPLLYYKLTTDKALECVPPQHLGSLRKDFRNSSARSLYERSQLGLILAAFRRREIPVIVLKGAHLAEAIYPDPALRRMNDIDLLLHKVDLPEAEKFMLEAGYRYHSDPRQDKAYRANVGFMSGNRKLIFELHWHLIIPKSRLNIDVERIWANSQPTIVAGHEVHVLCPEDLFLYQCYHTAKHLFEHYGLRSLYDILLIIDSQTGNLNWDTVVNRAKEWGVEKSMVICLRLAQQLFGLDIDSTIMKQLQDKELDGNIYQSAFQLIFRHHDRSAATLPYNIGRMLDRARPADKAAVLIKRLFPSRREMSFIYHFPLDSPIWWSYYPYRIIDLLIRHRRSLLLLMGREPKTLHYLERQKKIRILRRWLDLYEETFL